MRRLKNGTRLPPGPNANVPEFSRKKSRFSGKNRLNRVRLTCCWSASTCAKSVRIRRVERQRRRQAVLSRPLRRRSPSAARASGSTAIPSPVRTSLDAGDHERLDVDIASLLDVSSPRSVPASETRVALKRMGIGAQLLCSFARRTALVMLKPHSCDGELVEAQRLERNLEFRDPSAGEPADFDVPHAIPVDVPGLRRRWMSGRRAWLRRDWS